MLTKFKERFVDALRNYRRSTHDLRPRRRRPAVPSEFSALEPRRYLSAVLMQPLQSGGTIAAGERFGDSTDVGTKFNVVGEPNATVNGKANAGQVSVYEHDGALVRILQKPTPTIGDSFGRDVALSDQYIVVGADGDDTGAANAGAVYIFKTSDWSLFRTIKNPAPAQNDWFGWRVGISGNFVIASALGDNMKENSGHDDAGTVYIFSLSAGSLLQTFNDPTAHAGDFFGSDIAVSGSKLLIGAYGDDSGGTDSGAASVFDLQTGQRLAKFTNPTPNPNDRFGYSVALTPTFAFVGAPQDAAGAAEAGSVSIYSTNTWKLQRTINDSTPTAGGWFGAAIADNGPSLFVSAPQDSATNGCSGSVSEIDLQTWNLKQTIVGPSARSGDFFGGAIAASSDRLLIGAPQGTTSGISMGAAYLYSTADAGSALNFDGINDYVTVSTHHPALDFTYTFSIEAWVNFQADADGAIITRGSGGGADHSFALWRQNGMLQATVQNAGTHVAVPWTPKVGQWYHVAMTFNGKEGMLRLYVDGIEEASTPAKSLPAFDGHPIIIGADFDGGRLVLPFHGAIDNVRIWSTERSPSDITSNMTKVIPSGAAGLVVQFLFDEGSGARINNSNAAIDGLIYGVWETDSERSIPRFGSRRDVVSICGNRKTADLEPPHDIVVRWPIALTEAGKIHFFHYPGKSRQCLRLRH